MKLKIICGYHPNNVKYLSKTTGYKEKDIIKLAILAYKSGILFHIDGIPFGK